MRRKISRRSFMKNSAIAMGTVAMFDFIAIDNAFSAEVEQNDSGKGNILVTFFSHSGNTRFMAEQIHEQVGGDIVEIKTVNPYPVDYDSVVDQAKSEQKKNYRPKLTTKVHNLESYDVVFIGYPNWWGTLPMALFTYFEENDFSKKILVPFCTHEGSFLGRSVTDLKTLNPKATVLDGLAIQGKSVRSKSAREDIIDWLTKLKIAKGKQ